MEASISVATRLIRARIWQSQIMFGEIFRTLSLTQLGAQKSFFFFFFWGSIYWCFVAGHWRASKRSTSITWLLSRIRLPTSTAEQLATVARQKVQPQPKKKKKKRKKRGDAHDFYSLPGMAFECFGVSEVTVTDNVISNTAQGFFLRSGPTFGTYPCPSGSLTGNYFTQVAFAMLNVSCSSVANGGSISIAQNAWDPRSGSGPQPGDIVFASSTIQANTEATGTFFESVLIAARCEKK